MQLRLNLDPLDRSVASRPQVHPENLRSVAGNRLLDSLQLLAVLAIEGHLHRILRVLRDVQLVRRPAWHIHNDLE